MPDSFGDVTGEYLALRREAGLVTGTHEMLWVEGREAVSFLQGILSQDVEAIAQGAVARSLLLNPQGKLRALLWLLRGDQRVGIVADAGFEDAVASDLRYYRIRVKADIVPELGPVAEVWGPQAAEVITRAGLPVPEGWVDGVAALPLPGVPRYLIMGTEPDRLVEAGARRAGDLAVTAVRVEAGEPVTGRDVDHKTIPQEAGLVPSAASTTKGCYLGQELVARIDSRGRVNRHLRGVRVVENVLPPEGAELVSGDRPVGRLTSVAESLTLRAPVGLALVRREVAPGDRVGVRWQGGETIALVSDLPMV
ncbi:MAG: YgfZ/GcvT domain-containing protein [Acidimicrobiia bacterium]